MSYILHVESGTKIEIEGKDVAAIQAEIKEAGLIIGNVTLRRMVEGVLQAANGFELIEGLSAEEKEETQQALAQAQAEVSLKVAETVDAEAPISADACEAPVSDAPVDAVEDAVNAALEEGNQPSDAKIGSLASSMLKEASKGKTLTPQAALVERKRRHTKREEMVDLARASDHGPVLAAIEAGVVPGVFLSYVNPDMRWFQFPVTELANPENLHARTNTYVDVAPIVSGGWGFSLYVNGKSFTKRQKIKESDAESLVKAINEWLPQALAEAKAV